MRNEGQQEPVREPSKAEKRKAIAMKVAVVVLAALVIYGASAGLGAIATAMVAKQLVVAWQFGAINGAILGLKASTIALPIIARRCKMFSYTSNTHGDIRKFVKEITVTTAALTAVGALFGALYPDAVCEFMGYGYKNIDKGSHHIERVREVIDTVDRWHVPDPSYGQPIRIEDYGNNLAGYVYNVKENFIATRDYFLFADSDALYAGGGSIYHAFLQNSYSSTVTRYLFSGRALEIVHLI